MNALKFPALAAIAACWLICAVVAQDGPPPGENRPDPGGLRRGPVFNALDTNHDGILSGDEIAKAPVALQTLDKNHDGILGQDELYGPGGPGRGGPVSGPGMDGPRMRGPRGMDGGNAMSAEEEVKRYMTLDRNGDGKLTKDEVPPRMQRLFTRADANNDGVIAKEELDAMEKKRQSELSQHGGGRGGFGSPPPGE